MTSASPSASAITHTRRPLTPTHPPIRALPRAAASVLAANLVLASSAAIAAHHAGSASDASSACSKPTTGAPSQPIAELSALAGWSSVRASRSSHANPQSLRYHTGPTFALQARVHAAPWLQSSLFYQRTYVEVRGSIPSQDTATQMLRGSPVSAYRIGARLEPTYQFRTDVRAWLSLGVAWNRISLDTLRADHFGIAWVLPARHGTQMELPIGLGTSVQLIDGWLAVEGQVHLSPAITHGGSLFEPKRFVDGSGHFATMPAVPFQTVSSSVLLGLSLLL